MSLLFSAKDVGQKRSTVAIRELKSMNNLIRVLEDKSGSDIEAQVGNYRCVVLGSQDIAYAKSLNTACRAKNIPFVCSFSAGFIGSYFVDCGDLWSYKTTVKKEKEEVDDKEIQDTKENNETSNELVTCCFTSLNDLFGMKASLKDLNLFVLSQLAEQKQDKRQKSELEIDAFIKEILGQTKEIQFPRKHRRDQDALIREF